MIDHYDHDDDNDHNDGCGDDYYDDGGDDADDYDDDDNDDDDDHNDDDDDHNDDDDDDHNDDDDDEHNDDHHDGGDDDHGDGVRFLINDCFLIPPLTHLLHYTTSRFSLADGTRWDDDIEKLCLSLPQGWCVDLQWYVVGQPRDPDGWFYATSVDAPYWYPSSDDSSFCKCSLVQ